jgi:hypothetical protein
MLQVHGHQSQPASASLSKTTIHTTINLLHALRELGPVVHDGVGLALLRELLGHQVHLLLALLLVVDADVCDERDARAQGGGGAGLGVLDGDALGGLDAQLLAGVQVDGGVGLGARRVERGGGRVDVLVGEEAHEVGLDEGGDDAGLGRGRDDGHGVALLLEPLELLGDAGALDALLRELLDDLAELAVDVLVDFFGGHFELVLLLQADEHVAEVVADKVLKQGVGIVFGIDVVLLEHLVGEVGTCLKGETL